MTDSERTPETPGRSLGELQALALVAQVVTMVLSVLQSMVVVRLLTVAEFGLVGLALGAGGVLDVLQQLTVQSAVVRQLSNATEKDERRRVVTVALCLRLVLVLPNAVLIFVSANGVAGGLYSQPELRLPIQIMAITMLVNCGRAILENTLTGLHYFRTYYIYLVCAFVVRLVLFALGVWLWRVNGYFYAELVWGCLLTLVLVILVRPHLGRWAGLPSWDLAKPIALAMLGLSLVLFVGRLSYTWWRRGATALLGLVVSSEDVGLFHFGLGFAGQILAISGALGTVYLPLMSRLAREDRERFQQLLPTNLSQILVIFWLAVGILVLFAREAILVMAGPDYLPALSLVPPLVLAFFVQAVFTMLNTSALVPTGNDRWFLGSVLLGRGLSLAMMMAVLLWSGDISLGVWGFALGLLPGLVCMVLAVRARVGVVFWRPEYWLLLVLVGVWGAATLLDVGIGWRILLLSGVGALYVYETIKRGLVDWPALFSALRRRWEQLVRRTKGSKECAS